MDDVGSWVFKGIVYAASVYLYCKVTAPDPASSEVIGATGTYDIKAAFVTESFPRRGQFWCQLLLHEFEKASLTIDAPPASRLTKLGNQLKDSCKIDPEAVVSKFRMKNVKHVE